MATFPTESDRFGSSTRDNSGVFNAAASQQARPESSLAEIPVIAHASRRSGASAQPGQAQTVREETSTLLIFPRGALLRLSSTLSRGDLVVLTNQQNRADMLCRVVFVREQPDGGSYVELEFTQRSTTFWTESPAAARAALSSALNASENAATNSGPVLAPVLAFPGARTPVSFAQPTPPVAPLKEGAALPRADSPVVRPAALHETSGVSTSPTATAAAQQTESDPDPIISAARAAFAQAGAADVWDASEVELPPLRSTRTLVDKLKELSHSPMIWVFGGALTIAAFVGESYLMGHRSSPGSGTETASTRAMYPAQPASARAGAPSASDPITLNSISVVSATHPTDAKDDSAADASRTDHAGAGAAAAAAARHDALRIGNLAPTAQRPTASAPIEAPPELPAQGTNIADHLIGAGSLSGSQAAGGPAPVAASVPAASIAAANTPAAPPSDYRAPKMISSTAPVYPQFARAQGVAGTVVLDATIDATGKVTGATVVSGSPLLTQAALDAVRQWKYQPAQQNGQAVQSHATINVNFAHQ